MDEFVPSLKEIYKQRLLQSEDQCPPVRGNKLINLQLVEADKTEGFGGGSLSDKVKRTPILYCNVFKTDSGKKLVRRIVVEGNGGMGKTTLCNMLAEGWAEDKILTQFDCVLLLPLRDRRVSSATNLTELFKPLHASEKIRTVVVDEIGNGEGVLIIADGWDELDDDKRSKHSFLHNLLFGGLFPFASVLLTSRPSASAPLHNLKCVQRLIEIVGFNKENIEQYIQSEFSDFPEKSSSLIEQLENNPLIQSVCSVPLNCAIICHLWHTLKQFLPTTLTELYTKIVLNIIIRDVSKNFPECSIGLSPTNFDSIPQHLQVSFWLTCKFAYECLCRDQIVFSEDELISFFPEFLSSDIKFQCFGLLQSARSLLPVGHGLSFHFVHLTIQEFLAALHIATQSNEQKLDVARHSSNNTRFDMTMRFVLGLGTRKGYSSRIVCLNSEVVHEVISLTHFSLPALKKLCHFALESFPGSLTNQDYLAFAVTIEVASFIDGRFYVLEGGTPHDVTAALHVLRHSRHCCAKIDLNRCGVSDEQLTELTKILSNASSNHVEVQKLDLGNNRLSNRSIIELFKKASSIFSPLDNLSLDSCNILNIPQQILSPNMCKKLMHLSLSDNPLGVSGIQSLETAVQAGALGNLEWLNLSNTLTDDADINGALLTTLLPSLASHCCKLEFCHLSNNNLDIPGACAVGEAICLLRNKPILFGLNNTSITLDSLVTFCTRVLASKSVLVSLTLDNNSLGLDGLLTIIRLVRSSNCQVRTLGNSDLGSISQLLDPWYTRSTNLLTLCPVVQYSNQTKLFLGNNNLSGCKIVILAECIRVCQSLELLECSNCFLTATDVINLLRKLKSFCTVHKYMNLLDLSNNSIDNDKEKDFLDNVTLISEVFPVLEELDVTGNPIENEFNDCWQEHKRLVPRLGATAINISITKSLMESRRCSILTEWKRTLSPPQAEELLVEFLSMWDELLWELCYLLHIMDLCPHLFGLSTKVKGQSTIIEIDGDSKELPPVSSSNDEELEEPVDHHPTAGDESTQPTTLSIKFSAQPSPNDSGTPKSADDPTLTVNHMNVIFEVLWKARKNWYFIGEGLGCSTADLDEIEDRHHPDKQRCLHKMLQHRIQRGGLTCSMLCNSLRRQFVERDDVAQEIESLDLHYI